MRENPAGLAWVASRGEWRASWHHILLAEQLKAALTGRIPRLMVFMPPRHGKSELVSRYGAAWAVLALQKRVILASYEARFASWWGMQAREVAREWGPLMSGAQLSPLISSQNWWGLAGLETRASMMTAGVGGPITGKGGDILILDDPVKNAAEVASQTQRDSMWSWYTSTFRTRLQKGGSIILVMTRWHEDDIAGRLLKQMAAGVGEPWTVISLPALAERDEEWQVAGELVRRREGEALWPEMFDAHALAITHEDVGGDVWSALYQQSPVAEGGAIWKREWLERRYNYEALLEAKRTQRLRAAFGIRRIEQSVDSAWKEGTHSDYSVIATWGVTDTDYLLLDVWRQRVEYPALKRAIVEQAAIWNPSAILIEDAASGTAALQELRKTTRLPVKGISPDGSKVSRAQLVTPVGEAGHILLPDTAEWTAEWVEEHVRFPKAPHDDLVDTTSMALNSLRLHRPGRLTTF